MVVSFFSSQIGNVGSIECGVYVLLLSQVVCKVRPLELPV
jgi:hypothetical protein